MYVKVGPRGTTRGRTPVCKQAGQWVHDLGAGDFVWQKVPRVVEEPSAGLSSLTDLTPGRCHLLPGIVLLPFLRDRRCNGVSFKDEEGCGYSSVTEHSAKHAQSPGFHPRPCK